jgi:hypothetical protein
MLHAALEFEWRYPSIHIMLKREDKFYDELGRYEKLEEAKKIDKLMEEMLGKLNFRYFEFSCLDLGGIIDFIRKEIDKE